MSLKQLLSPVLSFQC